MSPSFRFSDFSLKRAWTEVEERGFRMPRTDKARPSSSQDLSESCRLVRTPDGGIRVECTSVEAAKQVFEAAVCGKFTVVFVPKREGFSSEQGTPDKG